MAKKTSSFFCSDCGHETTGWLGQCPGCGAWNTIVESTTITGSKSSQSQSIGISTRCRAGGFSPGGQPEQGLSLSQISREQAGKLPTGIAELDRVLGGGLVKGSVVLVGGVPGIGKSTLLMQVCQGLSAHGKIMYVSGEESPAQIGLRADRLGVSSPNILLFSEVSFPVVADYVEKNRPVAVIIDSIQTMYMPESASGPGSATQIRDVTAGMVNLAKSTGIAIILVGHVTKEGSIAGPKILEHMVDTVIYFEGDSHGHYRILRGVKNRFGTTDEIGLFEMTEKGLSQVSNPSSALLSGRPRGVPGTVITSVMEGTRPILVEIQALMNPVSYSNPQRITQGLDRIRTGMILAVLDKKLNLGLNSMDAYINVTGGLVSNEPASDMAIAAAVISAVRDKAIKESTLVFGEIGLTGEIRNTSSSYKRALEAAREGFKTCILPGASKRQFEKVDLSSLPGLIFVDNIGEMADLLF